MKPTLSRQIGNLRIGMGNSEAALCAFSLHKSQAAMVTTAAWLNRAGLILGAVGVVLIFIWGPPQPDLAEGVGLALEDLTPLPAEPPYYGRTVAEYNLTIRARRFRHNLLSRVGLALIGLGFAAQFVATYF